MNAYDWKRFPYTVSFLEPCQVAGVITDLEDFDASDGPATRMTIRQPNGLVAIVNAVQTRLRSELIPLDPQVGDRIRITYLGQAKKAAPGMSPTKEFRVEVKKQGSQPEAGTDPGARGSEESENGPRAGSKGT